MYGGERGSGKDSGVDSRAASDAGEPRQWNGCFGQTRRDNVAKDSAGTANGTVSGWKR